MHVKCSKPTVVVKKPNSQYQHGKGHNIVSSFSVFIITIIINSIRRVRFWETTISCWFCTKDNMNTTFFDSKRSADDAVYLFFIFFRAHFLGRKTLLKSSIYSHFINQKSDVHFGVHLYLLPIIFPSARNNCQKIKLKR